MKMKGWVFGLRRTLHRTGLVAAGALMAGYLCFFIAKGPRYGASVILAICFSACCFFVVLTSQFKK